MKEKGVRGKYLGKVDMKKTQTYHEGANDERTAILAKVRRIIKSGKPVRWQDFEIWLLNRVPRNKSNPGGL